MVYKPIVLVVFDTFVLLRRLDSIYKKQNDVGRVLAMFEEIYENLSKPDIQTDIIGEHRDCLLGYIFIIIYDIKNGLAPKDVLEQYIREVGSYVESLVDGIVEVQKSLRSNATLPGLLDKLPLELREIVAENSLI